MFRVDIRFAAAQWFEIAIVSMDEAGIPEEAIPMDTSIVTEPLEVPLPAIAPHSLLVQYRLVRIH